MKKIAISLISLLLVVGAYAQKPKTTPVLATNLDSISYIIGVDISHNLSQGGIDFNAQALLKGLEDGKAGKDSLTISKPVKDAVMGKWQKEKMSKTNAESAKKAEKYKKEGAAFLAENKKKEGVKTLPSGMQYKVIKEGAGEHPKATDKVKVHYHGTLIDGTVFDSSVQRGEPITFGLNQVIKGWTEGVQLMTPGSKYTFYIPSDLAYGDKDAPGGKIPGGSTLIFEVELFSIEK